MINFPNIDPIIVEIGPFAIRWYAMAYVVGIVGACFRPITNSVGFYHYLLKDVEGMSNYNKMFEDFNKIAGSAMNTAFHSVADFKKQYDQVIKQQSEMLLGHLDLVTREEFDVVKEMLSKSRSEQQNLKKQITELEKKLTQVSKASAAKPTAKAAPKAPTTKPAAPKAPAAKNKSKK